MGPGCVRLGAVVRQILIAPAEIIALYVGQTFTIHETSGDRPFTITAAVLEEEGVPDRLGLIDIMNVTPEGDNTITAILALNGHTDKVKRADKVPSDWRWQSFDRPQTSTSTTVTR